MRYGLHETTTSPEYVAASIIRSGLKSTRATAFSRFGRDTTAELPIYFNGEMIGNFIDSIRLDDLFRVFEALSRAEIHIKFKDQDDA